MSLMTHLLQFLCGLIGTTWNVSRSPPSPPVLCSGDVAARGGFGGIGPSCELCTDPLQVIFTKQQMSLCNDAVELTEFLF